MSTPLRRPEALLRPEAQPINHTTSPTQAAARLRDGEWLRITDSYHTGQDILERLRGLLKPPATDADYHARRAYRRRYRQASQRLLVPIVAQRLALPNAPVIGFLKQLYPERQPFMLSFADVQGLNGAWNWYNKGVYLAVLGHRVHPFYGTYVPARVSHLELFATWLSRYQGPRKHAIDVGTGCGVLALMLCKAGFSRVLATDSDPNAIESVRRELERLPSSPPLTLQHRDLLGEHGASSDLVVFNPPWMQGTVEEPLDRALYFEDGMFERFFDQAFARIRAKGRVVMVFSNLIELVQPDVPHPIEAELARGRFTLVQKLRRKVKASKKAGGRPRGTREKVEVWELAKATE